MIDAKYILDYYFIEYTSTSNSFLLFIDKAKIPVHWFLGTFSITLVIDTHVAATERDNMLYTIKNIVCCI